MSLLKFENFLQSSLLGRSSYHYGIPVKILPTSERERQTDRLNNSIFIFIEITSINIYNYFNSENSIISEWSKFELYHPRNSAVVKKLSFGFL